MSVSAKPPSNIENMPKELRDQILAKLPCNEVPKICLLSKSAGKICEDQNFWRNQYKLRHDVSVAAASTVFPSVWSKELRDPSDYRLEYGNECSFVMGRHKTIADSLVTCVTFSPDGSTIATGSDDRTAKLWDAHSLELKKTFNGHTDCVNRVAFSPDGSLLATGSDDRTAKLWDVGTGITIHTLLGHRFVLRHVAFSPDGLKLATTCSSDVRLWNVQSGQLNVTRTLHQHITGDIAFSPDGRTLATATFSGTVILLDAHSLELRRTLQGPDLWVHSVSFSPDGRTIATGTGHHTAMLKNLDTGTLHTLIGHDGPVVSVAFSPDGSLIATGSGDRTTKLWDARSGVLKATIQNLSTAWTVAFSPDGRTLAIGTLSATTNAVKLWAVLV